MEKYKIKDLLLIYESGDCRFGVLNNKKQNQNLDQK